MRVGLALLGVVGVLGSGSAFAQTVVYTGTGFTIPDNTTRTSIINVTAPTGTARISNVTFTLNNLTHTFVGDLSGDLSFNGRASTYMNATGQRGTLNGGYTFSDSANQGVIDNGSNGVNIPRGTYNVYTPLSPFNGLSSTGAWTLRLADTASRDTGNLGSWSLAITYASAAPEPGSWALMILGFGIVGYAMRRRRVIFVHVPQRIVFDSRSVAR